MKIVLGRVPEKLDRQLKGIFNKLNERRAVNDRRKASVANVSCQQKSWSVSRHNS